MPELPREKPRGVRTLGLLAVLALLVTQTDVVERGSAILDQLRQPEPETQSLPIDTTAAVDPPTELVQEEARQPDTPAQSADEVSVVATEEEPQPPTVPDPVPPAPEPAPVVELIDFSKLPPATMIIPLATGDSLPPHVEITLVENGREAIVDLVRETGIGQPLLVDFDEIGFSGNRSPWQTGQYQIANNGLVTFDAGQPRVRTTISMTPDPLREPDRNVTLLLRDGGNANAELATINLRLEDDDQRRFEAGLPTDTIAFAVSRISVHENDPAAQIDIIRFNPGNERLTVGYQIRGVTAQEGEDFFEPRSTSISFGAGQRSARILIPLVQDSAIEGDEAFILELIVDASLSETDLFRRIAVMIRDDDN